MNIAATTKRPHGGGSGGATPKPVVPGVGALMADTLVDSFGVRTAFSEKSSGAYGGWASSTNVGDGSITPIVTALTTLGVRHVREGLRAASGTTVAGAEATNQKAAFLTLSAAGIKLISSLGNITSSPPVSAYLDWVLANFTTPTDVFEYFEGPNEPNGTGAPSNWPDLVAQRVKDAYVACRTNATYSTLSTIGLVNSSIQGGASQHTLFDNAASAIGGGVAAENFIDYGCYHVYCGQATPGVTLPSWNVQTRGDLARGDANGKGVMCTESGMFDTPDPATPPFVYHPIDVQNVYAPRMLLEHIYRGEKRHYWFELLDDHAPASTNKEDHFGLISYGSTYPVKATYTTMKYLFDLTKDPGAVFTPAGLNMTTTGTGADYRQVVFKKRGVTGKYYLAVWRDVSVWDWNTQTAATVSPTTVTVTLGSAQPVTLHNPSRQSTIAKGTVSSFTVDTATGLTGLRGEVVVAEIG